MANDNSLARRPGRSRICPGKSACGKVFPEGLALLRSDHEQIRG